MFIEALEAEKPLKVRIPHRVDRSVRREREVLFVWTLCLLVGIFSAIAADPAGADADLDSITLPAMKVPAVRWALRELGEDDEEVEVPVWMLLVCSKWIVSLSLDRPEDEILSGPPLLS